MRLVAGVVSLLAILAAPAIGHHAFTAEFDADKPVKLNGTVTLSRPGESPRLVLHRRWRSVRARRKLGIEMGSPNIPIRAGWGKNTLKIGDAVTVEGSRAKNGSNIANAKVVILDKTGQKLFAGSSQGQPAR